MHQHHQFDGHPDVWTLLSPGSLLFALALIALYFVVIGPWRHRFEGGEEVAGKQKFGFVSAMVVYYIASGPIYAYSHNLFSFHMIWMSLIYLAMPPLILYGTPAWVWRPLWKNAKVTRVLRFFTHPLIAIALFNGLLSVYHLPVLFDTIMTNALLMGVSHVILMITAFFMWWPVMCPIPELDRLNPLQKMAYIFADGVLLTPACAIIAFSHVMLYDFYQGAPQVFMSLTAHNDQSLGGVAMKIVQEIVYGIVLGYNFFAWVRQQKEQDRLDQEEDENEREAAPEGTVSYNHI
ncbi:hypothetical protein GXN76_02400 [Kroppenstedtia pulmonis]|uniref:Cytochrome c oxidase assembly factor CtaG n=1 Tax=Kroppenstedtia pulmonis TaxID=1380685 RepID=A0A7D4CDI9_9BACL|nr:cytochrome c oxidase assembly protein [Kroppenstedtia pulmonis]QKG83434.1 hypothetical protein GXN76_02400 [Kroppenstedtia pulmonis]